MSQITESQAERWQRNVPLAYSHGEYQSWVKFIEGCANPGYVPWLIDAIRRSVEGAGYQWKAGCHSYNMGHYFDIYKGDDRLHRAGKLTHVRRLMSLKEAAVAAMEWLCGYIEKQEAKKAPYDTVTKAFRDIDGVTGIGYTEDNVATITVTLDTRNRTVRDKVFEAEQKVLDWFPGTNFDFRLELPEKDAEKEPVIEVVARWGKYRDLKIGVDNNLTIVAVRNGGNIEPGDKLVRK